MAEARVPDSRALTNDRGSNAFERSAGVERLGAGSLGLNPSRSSEFKHDTLYSKEILQDVAGVSDERDARPWEHLYAPPGDDYAGVHSLGYYVRFGPR